MSENLTIPGLAWALLRKARETQKEEWINPREAATHLGLGLTANSTAVIAAHRYLEEQELIEDSRKVQGKATGHFFYITDAGHEWLDYPPSDLA
jgi:hypothetical protein